jgi:hypothetical protein
MVLVGGSATWRKRPVQMKAPPWVRRESAREKSKPMGVGLEGGLLAVPEQSANSMNPVTITAATDRFIGS